MVSQREAAGRSTGLTRKYAHADQSRRVAVRAMARPGRRRVGDSHDDHLVECHFDLAPPAVRRGMFPAEVADAMNTAWQHMLQVAAQELGGVEGAATWFTAGRVAVTKTNVLLGRCDDALVADGGALDIAGEILDRGFAGTDRLQVDHPRLAPTLRWNLRMPLRQRCSQGLFETSAEGGGHRRGGQQPVRPTGLAPFFVVGTQATARHDVVDVLVAEDPGKKSRPARAEMR